jgi:hypothetical protein
MPWSNIKRLPSSVTGTIHRQDHDAVERRGNDRFGRLGDVCYSSVRQLNADSGIIALSIPG